MKVSDKKLENGDLEVVLTFDRHEQLCLEHDLEDIVSWYSIGPASEKIHSCRKRMIQEHKDLIMKDPSIQSKTLSEVNAILEDEKQMVELIVKHPEYKNRKLRELDLR